MKNKIYDVNNILIEQLERLNDTEICCNVEAIEIETKKAQAMVNICSAIVQNGMLQLKAMEVADKCGYTKAELPTLLLS